MGETCVGDATDRSATRALICRLLLIGDGVQNEFRGPRTTWNPPAPSNPAHDDYTHSRYRLTHDNTGYLMQ